MSDRRRAVFRGDESEEEDSAVVGAAVPPVESAASNSLAGNSGNADTEAAPSRMRQAMYEVARRRAGFFAQGGGDGAAQQARRSAWPGPMTTARQIHRDREALAAAGGTADDDVQADSATSSGVGAAYVPTWQPRAVVTRAAAAENVATSITISRSHSAPSASNRFSSPLARPSVSPSPSSLIASPAAAAVAGSRRPVAVAGPSGVRLQVPSLAYLCMELLTRHLHELVPAPEGDGLGPLPPGPARSQFASAVCRARAMDGHAFRLFAGSDADVVDVADCAGVDEASMQAALLSCGQNAHPSQAADTAAAPPQDSVALEFPWLLQAASAASAGGVAQPTAPPSSSAILSSTTSGAGLGEGGGSQLRNLRLGHCGRGFTPATVLACAAAGIFAGLRVLDIHGAYSLAEEHVAVLLAAAPQLLSLRLAACPLLTGAFVAQLGHWCPCLQHVCLDALPLVGDAALLGRVSASAAAAGGGGVRKVTEPKAAARSHAPATAAATLDASRAAGVLRTASMAASGVRGRGSRGGRGQTRGGGRARSRSRMSSRGSGGGVADDTSSASAEEGSNSISSDSSDAPASGHKRSRNDIAGRCARGGRGKGSRGGRGAKRLAASSASAGVDSGQDDTEFDAEMQRAVYASLAQSQALLGAASPSMASSSSQSLGPLSAVGVGAAASAAGFETASRAAGPDDDVDAIDIVDSSAAAAAAASPIAAFEAGSVATACAEASCISSTSAAAPLAPSGLLALPRLVSMSLMHLPLVTDSFLGALFRAGVAPRLIALALSHLPRVSDEGLLALIGGSCGKGLTPAVQPGGDSSGTEAADDAIEDRGVDECVAAAAAAAAAGAPPLPLRRLLLADLSRAAVTDNSIVQLARRCSGLTHLILRRLGPGVTVQSLLPFAVANARTLRHVSLVGMTGASDAFAVALVRHCGSSSSTTPGSAASSALAARTPLQSLDVSFSHGVGDAAVGELVDASPRLARLAVWGCTRLSDAFFDGHMRAAEAASDGEGSLASSSGDAWAPLRVYGRWGDVVPEPEYTRADREGCGNQWDGSQMLLHTDAGAADA